MSSRRHFKNFLDGYLEYTSDLEATKRINTFSGISGVGAMLERRVFCEMSYGPLFPNLFTYIVGPPGRTRKSSSTNMMVKLLEKLPDFKMMANKITAAAMLDEIEKAQKTVKGFDGQDYTHCSTMLYASELKNTFNMLGGTVAEQLTELYDSGPSFKKQTKHSGANYLYNVCLNILACTTVDWLLSHIGVDEVEGGLASRILFVVENGEPEKLVALPKVTAKMTKLKHMLLEDMAQIYSLRGECTFTASAAEAYTTWYNQHRNIDSHKVGAFIAFMARKDVHVIKLAMIHAVCLGNDLVITPSNIEWAIKQLNSIEPDIERAFIVGRNALYRDSCEVFNFIEQQGKVDRAMLLNRVARNTRGKELQEILNDLIERKKIRMLIEDNTTLYCVAPASIHTRSRSTKLGDGSDLDHLRNGAKSTSDDRPLAETSDSPDPTVVPE